MEITCEQQPATDTLPVKALLENKARFWFFTGKGGVGKTSLASATSVALADAGHKVLLISTDPASNLDEVLSLQLSRNPRPVPACEGLYALNINPEEVAAEYRARVIGPMKGLLPPAALQAMEEQLSGACTMEIAAFDEFAGYLQSGVKSDYDFIIFDTAPTGHTLRLMALSSAWNTFFDGNTSGNSCLGPLAGLEKQRRVYAEAVETLKDGNQTAVFLVTRPSRSPIREAQRTCEELKQLGIVQQHLLINGWLTASCGSVDDPVASAWIARQSKALADAGEFIHSLPAYRSDLLPLNVVGLEALRMIFAANDERSQQLANTVDPLLTETPALPGLNDLVDRLAGNPFGVLMTMGKGGVGKTTVACALALALADRGLAVTLSTTDPAAHITDALDANDDLPLRIERIDPVAETAAYVAEVMANQGTQLDESGRALLEEDLRSPCTEEIAVFRAFARTVAEGKDRLVVLDTAPTGHTLLLLDATQSYHRELGRQSRASGIDDAVEQLLPRLRDPNYTRTLIVTLAESTPVHEAEALQADLRRAGITPFAWIINQSLVGCKTSEPILAARSHSEIFWIKQVLTLNPATPNYLIPWLATEPVGAPGLRALTGQSSNL